MTITARPIVLDANILIRGAIGAKVPALMVAHGASIDFLAPDVAFEEARQHLPTILRARGDTGAGEKATMAALDAIAHLTTPIPLSNYELLRTQAMARIGRRDPKDWPVLACALLLNCPIWTEDRDFFGTGVATWTTATVELYLAEASASAGTDPLPPAP